MDNVIVNIVEEPINVQVNIVEEPIVVTVNVSNVQGDAGISAYQVALNNGFVGSESDWLLSLKGVNDYVVNEVPSGLINGINATFTTAFNFIPTSVEVFLNGLKQKIIDDYQITNSNTIQLNTSPNAGEK